MAVSAPAGGLHMRLVAGRARLAAEAGTIAISAYVAVQMLAGILNKAQSTETEKLIAATRGITVDTAMGPIGFRASDHQSTMGLWVGKLDVVEGRGAMVDWRYIDGKDFQLDDAAVKARRPAEATQ